ncbi:hypothetical protein [Endozoicomonas sp. 8E]|uniref:hypothetical protein n=1 Tax=Endozoicomonas sp. 8E TaxID=3035692 RepID=UPI002938EAA3|nr:hypothetical protein [Endozoicomonas sp. 8E]WOG30223.1 hypothetical protein P6910_11415 [Endozoicomonas sp. 8E]
MRPSIRDAFADSSVAAGPLGELVLPKEKMSVTQQVEQRRKELNSDSYDEEHSLPVDLPHNMQYFVTIGLTVI